ncbi:MAG TPA: hypothetical protein EYN89_08060 [Flavobacteriales bacterium]|nr:hypothetical protein [Flavobacteriales bacterium]
MYLKIIAFEDSVQRLAGMSEKERNKAIKKIINKVIEEERQKKQEEASPRYNNSETKELMRSSGSQWYFYNPTALNFGYSEFEKKWGIRKLEDNWRRKNKSSIDFSIEENEENEEEYDETDEEGYELTNIEVTGNLKDKKTYLDHIPLTRQKMKESTNRIIEAYYSLGNVYKEFLMDDNESINSYEELMKRYPDNKYATSCYYHLYRLYMEKGNIAKSNYYKNKLIKQYPDSDYTKLIQNPDYVKQLLAEQNKVMKYYDKTYKAFKNNQFPLAINRCEKADSLFPKNKLRAKFAYLKALAIGKSQDINLFEAALKEVISNHPDDEVKIEAEKTLALINTVKTALSETENQPDSSKSSLIQNMYSFDKRSKHYYVILIADTVVEINKLKNEISDYNKKFFSIINLNTENILLDLDQHLIMVKYFQDSDLGIDYYNSITVNIKAIPSLTEENYEGFIISEENFPILFREKQIEKYLSFFSANYLEE